MSQRDIEHFRGLYNLAFIDKSCVEDQNEAEKASMGQFFKSNLTNQKLQLIGSSFIKMMIKGQLYYYTLDDPSKSRLARDLRTAEKIEEYYLYASSDAVLCYTYYIKFIIDRGSNIIPLVFHNKNKKLAQLISNYEKLFDIQVSDMSTKVSTNSSINT